MPGHPAEGVLTGNGGEFSLLSVQPNANTDYRARFVQGSNTTTSRTVEVGVKVNVGLNVLRKHIKSGNDVVLSGVVSPAQSQGSLKLTIKRDGQKFTRSASLSNSAFQDSAQGQGQAHGDRQLRPGQRPIRLHGQQEHNQEVHRPLERSGSKIRARGMESSPGP